MHFSLVFIKLLGHRKRLLRGGSTCTAPVFLYSNRPSVNLEQVIVPELSACCMELTITFKAILAAGHQVPKKRVGNLPALPSRPRVHGGPDLARS
jgi:hypothetical protein